MVNKTRKMSKRTVSFTIPNVPRPAVSWRQLAPKQQIALAGIIFIVVVFLAGYGGADLAYHHSQQNSLVTTTSIGGGKKVVTSESQLISKIASQVGQSVVSVNVNITSDGSGTDIFGLDLPQNEQAAGTGIIIASSGIIVTNRHVVPSGTTQVSVTLSDGTELKDVSVIGRTADNDSLDVAFLKINNTQGHKLVPATIGDSASVQVGDDVVAIGNALGQFQNTVTHGIISGYGRSVQASDSSGSVASGENLTDLFQTDAAINEGNSGGPLVNLNGQVIGINTAVAGNAQNIGFAIPINDVKGLINQVLQNGSFKRPYLGVEYVSLNADVANQYGLKLTNGAFIPPSNGGSPSVIAGSPAESAGLQERDIITSVDGTAVDQQHSLTGLLAQHQPGDHVTLTVVRGDQTLHVGVTLGSLLTPGQ